MTDRKKHRHSSEKSPKPFRSGYVAILGRPNAGKSTLMNRLIGEKVAIVSEKPQTTRDAIIGILTRDDFQIIFNDTPGLIEPLNLLNKCLMDSAAQALKEVDLIYHIVDVTDTRPLCGNGQSLIAHVRVPRFLLINKTDCLGRPFRFQDHSHLPNPADYTEVFPISALTGDNIEYLITRTAALLPEGPLYYEPGQISDRNLRFLCAEIVREKTFQLMGQELPYSVAVQVEEFRENEEGKTFIRTVIYVERDSQKGMIIGKGGAMLKNIGSLARPEIEQLVGSPVFLELWVKVQKKWTRNESDLRRFGYIPRKSRGEK
ncbi:MAG TPA: GTPase Era [Candidatus Sumerlaeota bacterium]|nr:GTPase Era [Candidatus Sumerlaeota bacterium]